MLFIGLSACGSDDDDNMASSADAAGTPMKVMSYNIRYSNTIDLGDTSWDSRRQPSIDMIRDENPDIIGLQEPSRRPARGTGRSPWRCIYNVQRCRQRCCRQPNRSYGNHVSYRPFYCARQRPFRRSPTPMWSRGLNGVLPTPSTALPYGFIYMTIWPERNFTSTIPTSPIRVPTRR